MFRRNFSCIAQYRMIIATAIAGVVASPVQADAIDTDSAVQVRRDNTVKYSAARRAASPSPATLAAEGLR